MKPDTAVEAETRNDEKQLTADATAEDDDDYDDSYAIPETVDPQLKEDCKKRFHTVLDFCWISQR